MERLTTIPIGEHAFISGDATRLLSSTQPSTGGIQCFQCLEMIEDVKKTRNHVGKHILRSMRGVQEAISGIPVSRKVTR